jgi:hypothetical protein
MESDNMTDRLVTVATFANSVEANLARNRLVEAGIKAFLGDEEAVNMAWYWTSALGGIKLQVPEGDVDAALALLTEDTAIDQAAPGEAQQPQEARAAEFDEPEIVPTSREQNANRAFKGAILGLLLWPLQLYAFWLLLQVFISEERLGPDQRRNALVAAFINLPVMFGLCLILRAIL